MVVVQRLLASGADPRAKNRKGLSASDYARRDGHDEVVRLLERFGK
jgi:ankyrin repeat protein